MGKHPENGPGDVQGNDILVVDDNINNLKLLEGILRAAGYLVRLATDGELALRSAMVQPPALILLDIRMPGMDGFEVCRRLKADERTQDIPVIFISILEDEHDKVDGFKAGAVDYLTKPIQPEETLARIATHLRLRELTERLEQKVCERTEALTLANQQLQQEIAGHKQAQDEIALLNFALNHVHEAAYLIDENGHFRFVNEDACRALGYSREKLLTLEVADIDPEWPSECWPEHWQDLKAQKSIILEGHHRSKDGRIIPVEINANYFEYRGQGFNLALVRDISARKEAEAALRALNDELDQRVRERTAELADKNEELERLNQLFVGRELKMIELKEKIKELAGVPEGEGLEDNRA
ncbi:MAG: response regulator [Desulfuromonadaceae bacterium]